LNRDERDAGDSKDKILIYGLNKKRIVVLSLSSSVPLIEKDFL